MNLKITTLCERSYTKNTRYILYNSIYAKFWKKISDEGGDGIRWEGEITKGDKDTYGVHCLDCGHDFTDVNICQNSSDRTPQRAVWWYIISVLICVSLKTNKVLVRNYLYRPGGPEREPGWAESFGVIVLGWVNL